MNYLFLLAAALACCWGHPAHAQYRLRFDDAVWEKTFEDNFDGTTLDTIEWATSPDKKGNPNRQLNGWGSEWYDAQDTSLVTVSQGVAHLKAKRWVNDQLAPQAETVTINNITRTVRYRSGMLLSRGGFRDWRTHSLQSAFGAWEARIKLPTNRNAWPAFWLWSPGTEIDIVDGMDVDNHTQSGLFSNVFDGFYKDSTAVPHYQQNAAPHRLKIWGDPSKPYVTVLSDDFHTYSIVWTPSILTFFVDGVETRSVPRSEVVTRDGYPEIRLTLQMWYWAGSEAKPDLTEMAQMDVDWVRIRKPKAKRRRSNLRDYEVPATSYKVKVTE
jgi:beta-glucanase (GH16 family)